VSVADVVFKIECSERSAERAFSAIRGFSNAKERAEAFALGLGGGSAATEFERGSFVVNFRELSAGDGASAVRGSSFGDFDSVFGECCAARAPIAGEDAFRRGLECTDGEFGIERPRMRGCCRRGLSTRVAHRE
jgi:hypothetical protein